MRHNPTHMIGRILLGNDFVGDEEVMVVDGGEPLPIMYSTGEYLDVLTISRPKGGGSVITQRTNNPKISAKISGEICISNDGGNTPHPSVQLDYPSIKIFVLGEFPSPNCFDKKYEETYRMALEVQRRLHGASSIFFDEKYPKPPASKNELEIVDSSSNKTFDLLVSCAMIGGINRLGLSEFGGRPLYTLNFNLIVQGFEDETIRRQL